MNSPLPTPLYANFFLEIPFFCRTLQKNVATLRFARFPAKKVWLFRFTLRFATLATLFARFVTAGASVDFASLFVIFLEKGKRAQKGAKVNNFGNLCGVGE